MGVCGVFFFIWEAKDMREEGLFYLTSYLTDEISLFFERLLLPY